MQQGHAGKCWQVMVCGLMKKEGNSRSCRHDIKLQMFCWHHSLDSSGGESALSLMPWFVCMCVYTSSGAFPERRQVQWCKPWTPRNSCSVWVVGITFTVVAWWVCRQHILSPWCISDYNAELVSAVTLRHSTRHVLPVARKCSPFLHVWYALSKILGLGPTLLLFWTMVLIWNSTLSSAPLSDLVWAFSVKREQLVAALENCRVLMVSGRWNMLYRTKPN